MNKMTDEMAGSGQREQDRQPPSFREAFLFWLKLGFISFGGPTGQIAMMHTEVVEKKKWVGEGHFLHALNFCMLLPGPEAQQLAIYIGWLLHKTRGRHRRGRPLCHSINLYSLGAELHLCRLRSRSLDCRDLLRTEAGRARDRRRSRDSHRQQSTQERCHVGNRHGGVRGDLFFPRAISLDHRRRWDHGSHWREDSAAILSRFARS
jgi:hypothetical protein